MEEIEVTSTKPTSEGEHTRTFVCDRCHKPITDMRKGVVQHSSRINFPAPKGGRPEGERRGLLTVSQLHEVVEYEARLERSKYGVWELGHLTCLQNVQEDYWFRLNRCNTAAKALSWTAHCGTLLSPLFRPCDWAHFLRRHFGRVVNRPY